MDATSQLAFHNMQISGLIGSWHTRIITAMEFIQYGTKGTLAEMLNASEEQVHKRLSELARKGEIVKTSKHRRSEKTGQKQTVWALPGVDLNLIKD